MSFDIDDFYIREQGYQEDLKRTQQALKDEIRKKYAKQEQVRKNNAQEALDTARKSPGLSHIRSKAIKDAQKIIETENLKVQKMMQAEYKKELQKRKEFLSKKHFQDVGDRDEQLLLAKRHEKKRALDASNQAKEEFNKRNQKGRVKAKFNHSVHNTNREKIQARRARLREGKDVNSINLQRPSKGRDDRGR